MPVNDPPAELVEAVRAALQAVSGVSGMNYEGVFHSDSEDVARALAAHPYIAGLELDRAILDWLDHEHYATRRSRVERFVKMLRRNDIRLRSFVMARFAQVAADAARA